MSAIQLSTSVNTAGPFAYPPPSGFGVWPSTTPNLPKADSSGFELINKGDIIPSSGFLEVFLPQGYSNFQLRMSQMTFSAQDQLAFYVSYDAGVTNITTASADSYSMADMTFYQSTTGSSYSTVAVGLTPTSHASDVYFENYDAWDAVAYLAAAATNFDWYMDFTPGDSTHYFKGMIKMMADKIFPNFGGGFGLDQGAVTLNPTAIGAPAKDRVNYIRFGPYRNIIGSDATHKMSAGKWYLLGIKD